MRRYHPGLRPSTVPTGKLWSNNPQERLNLLIGALEGVGIFGYRHRLVRPAHQWAEASRYLTIPNAVGNVTAGAQYAEQA